MKHKLNTITRTIMVACFSLASISSFASCEESIKDFYIAYMQNAQKMNEEANIALKQAYMRPQLIAKIAKETERTDADAVLMAQDVSQYGIESLTVERFKAAFWYLVKYRFSADSDEIVIYVKACDLDGKFNITDMAWNADAINPIEPRPYPYQNPYYLNGGDDGLMNDLCTPLFQKSRLYLKTT